MTRIDVLPTASLVVPGCAAQPGPDAAPAPASFAPRQVSRVYTQSLAAPPEQVLPLLTPLGEKAWASGWEPVILFEAPSPGTGTVFITRHPGQPDTLWLLDRFDADQRIVRYVHVTPGSDVTEIDISLRSSEGASGRTDAVVRYTYTGLGERGNALVDSMTEEHYRHFMIEWEQELNAYLASR